MVDIPTMERAFRRLGITGQASALLMVAFGILIVLFPNLTDYVLGAFFVVTGLLQLVGNVGLRRITKSDAAKEGP